MLNKVLNQSSATKSKIIKVSISVSSRMDAGSIRNLITGQVISIKKGGSIRVFWLLPTNVWSLQFSMLNAWWDYTPELTGKIKARVKSSFDTEYMDWDYAINGGFFDGDSQFMLLNSIATDSITMEFN